MSKEPHGSQVTNNVQIGLTKFDMFMLQSDDAYVSLQAPISIDESIQPPIIIGGSIVVVEEFILDVHIEVANGGADNVKEYNSSFNNVY